MTPATVVELQVLLKLAQEILASSATWEVKYDLIFSKDMSKTVFALVKLDYVDPDTSYEEDVRAFVEAFSNKMKDFGDLLTPQKEV